MNQCKRSTGFTLLEMLVVLGVFAVLGVISAQLVRT
jgi:prepilin-type N-terminal cleavage/methylation domain-containing protein